MRSYEIINYAAKNLRRVNELMLKFLNYHALPFSEKEEIWLFFRNYSELYKLLSANNSTDNEMIATQNAVNSLLYEVNAFLNIYLPNEDDFGLFETEADCDAILGPLRLKWEHDSEESNRLNKEYNTIDHRLDYMSDSDPDYLGLRDLCYRLYDEQKAASELAKKSRMDYEYKRRDLYGIQSFNLKWLFMLITQLKVVASSLSFK